MNAHQPRTNAVIPVAALNDEDFTGKEGYFVKAHASGRAALLTSASEMPLGVIIAGAPPGEKNSIGVPYGGLVGTVRVKLGVDINFGDLIKTRADATAGLYTSTTGEVFMGMALESGVAGELIEAALSNPYLV